MTTTERLVAQPPVPADPRDPRPLVVGLGGTTKSGSTTERLVAATLEAAAELGAATLLLRPVDFHLPMYSPELAGRVPEAAGLVDALRRADGVVLGSPGYHGSVSGLLKNALDYVEDLRDAPRPYLEGRAVGCIACAGGWQATGSTLAALRSVVHALRGWPTPLGVAVNAAQPVFDADGIVDPGLRSQLQILGEQVVEFARARALLT